MTDTQEVKDQDSSGQHNNDSSERKKKNKFAVKEEITEENCRFDEGQILKFVRVRFPGHAKSYAFLVGQRNLVYGKKVVAMSDRGMAVGYINSFPYELPFKKDMLPLRSINKAATEEDISTEVENYKKQKEIETLCQNLIEKHKLSMNLTHVEFTQFGKKVVFYFVAPSRVDFRGMVKDLVAELRLRIELRQISVRDRAASQGAIGPCGRELCCSSFLSKYGNVSIKMAKNQNLTLNYSKLNGVCGQLKCCLQYEDEVYSQKRKALPNEGDFVQTKNGDSGKVRKLNILSQQFDMLTDRGQIKRYTYEELAKTYKNDEYKFPRQFDHVSDETGTVIGLSEKEAKISRQFERDMEKMNKRSKKFAAESLDEIAEFLPERDRSNDYTAEELDESISSIKEVEEAPVQIQLKPSPTPRPRNDDNKPVASRNTKKPYRPNKKKNPNSNNSQNANRKPNNRGPKKPSKE
ncbi:MAG: cell fate regulator YaaT (PSP1 superfamily) [Bacteriovoracaceae bacterium]|jgi:cell fate regulator YaaT (PSP1 superfamily)